MSRFYANIQGSRGEATRQGTTKSGIKGHIRGWDIGVRVDCFPDKDGNDTCTVILTGGSNGEHKSRYIGTFRGEDIK